MHAPLTITVITLGKGGQFLGLGADGRRGPKLGEHCLAMAHLDTFNSLDNDHSLLCQSPGSILYNIVWNGAPGLWTSMR